jgi:site-specific DNA-methyltransferase (adenine-specific)
MINLNLGDCMEAMALMPDKAYDLAIVDPEYGIGESMKTQSRPLTAKQKNGTRLPVKGARKYEVKQWDKKRPSSEYFQELRRVSEHQIIWGGNYFADLLPASKGWIVWDKVNEKSDQSDCELAWTSFDRGLRKVTFLWNGFLQGQSILEGRFAKGNKKLNQQKIHPTEKPIPVYQWLLKNYAKPGWNILDTHGGSAAIAIACYEMGFDLDLWEIDEEYYHDAAVRFNQHVAKDKAQGSLFAPNALAIP